MMKSSPLIAVTMCLLLAAAALLPVQSFAPQPAPVELGEFLYTVPLSKEKEPRAAAQEWYYEYLEPGVNDSVFTPLLDMISNNSVPLYKPQYPFNVKCTTTEARKSIIRTDSVTVEDPDHPGSFSNVIAHFGRRADHVQSITFHEVWTYDAATLTLVKTVKGIILNVQWGWGTEPRVRPTVYIPFRSGPDGDTTINVSLAYRFATTSGDSAITANQVKVQNQLLADVRNKPSDKNFTVYDAAFPFTTVADKSMKATMAATVPVANSLLFYESWAIDPRNRTFRKTVRGIVPQIAKQINMAGGSSEHEYRNLAFIPFGRYVPVAPVSTTVQQISYNVNFRHTNDAYSGYAPVNPQFRPGDSARMDSVAVDIAEHVKRYEVKIFAGEEGNFLFDPFTNTQTELTPEQVRRFFVYGDSVMVEDPQNPGEVKTEYREWEIGHDVNCGFRFYESWSFDPAAYRFTKSISCVGMNALIRNRYDEGNGHEVCRYFYYNPQTSVEAIRRPEYLVARNVISTVLLNENEFATEEADDGRAIVRYADIHHNNIDASQRYALFQPMIRKILDGKITVSASMESKQAMTPTGFRNMMNAVISKNTLHVAKGMEFTLFNQLFFYEDWYYNPVSAQLYKEVKAVTFAYRGPDVAADGQEYRKVPDVQPCFTLVVNPVK